MRECMYKEYQILVTGKLKLRKGRENKGAGWRGIASLIREHFSKDSHEVEGWTLPASQGRTSRPREQYMQRLRSGNDSVPHRE